MSTLLFHLGYVIFAFVLAVVSLVLDVSPFMVLAFVSPAIIIAASGLLVIRWNQDSGLAKAIGVICMVFGFALMALLILIATVQP